MAMVILLTALATLVSLAATMTWVQTDNGVPWTFALWLTTAAAGLWFGVYYVA